MFSILVFVINTRKLVKKELLVFRINALLEGIAEKKCNNKRNN
jgi:hypothetical protein